VTSRSIVLFGAGGHARACIDVLEREGRYQIVGLVAGTPDDAEAVLGYPVIGTDADADALRSRAAHALVAIGQIRTAEPRQRLFELLKRCGYDLPAVVSPGAWVSPRARIGAGTIVMHGVVVNAGAEVGMNCILNNQALIEHDAVVGDHCHVSTGAILNGGARAGSGTFVGSGAVVREGVSLGERCLIGMGQMVLADCADDTRLSGRRARG
jgi:sugar O-acyltransferase (sialic acid O-acetyltransferase NeuD family)